MKSIKIVIPFLLLAFILTGVSCGDSFDKDSKKDKEEKEEEKKTEDENYSLYENKSWGFEIKYPDDWEKEVIANEYNGMAVGFLSPLENDEDNFQENIVVIAAEPNPDDFDELMEEAIESLRDYEYGELIDSSEKTISSYPGYELIYTDSYSGEIKKQLHCFINASDVWYQILYTADENKFIKYLARAKTVINSFKIIK